MDITPGLKLKSAASTAEFIVIRAPGRDVQLTCAGAALGPHVPDSTDAPSGADELLIGKRYRDEESTVELLCTRSGPGPLLLDGRPLAAAAAKALPSSD
ncbi:hypothetical protein [Streptomyces soliscabiei]|uniref:hypothetical protein n=1 Tax=Streptomyces soliscabiei TaxID=588897 RepID=UPI0029A4249A|nr:hypothetical protein [Streptomyces sp. NY05-11A]MDX2676691.1 hypothetical protein [Streptomyces sp. NY05-11A]